MLNSVYLGDGIYASQDPSFPLILTTGHHEQSMADRVIAFEPEVLIELEAYILLIKQQRAKGL